MRYTFIVSILITIFLATVTVTAHAADFVVIINKTNSTDLNKGTVKKIYVGDMTSWPDGGRIAAVDLPDDNPVRSDFTSEVVGKTISNIKALWAQKLVTGRGVPPKTLASDDEVKAFVAGDKNAIGYIKASSIDGSVKAVLK